MLKPVTIDLPKPHRALARFAKTGEALSRQDQYLLETQFAEPAKHRSRNTGVALATKPGSRTKLERAASSNITAKPSLSRRDTARQLSMPQAA